MYSDRLAKGRKNSRQRQEKSVILIIAEGKNATETLYFRQFQEQQAKFTIKLLKQGSSSVTDPKGMLELISKYWSRNGLDKAKGDRAYIVLDLDTNEAKANLLKRLSRSNENVRFIVSNPCFEVWFLLHYKYSTRPYHSSREVISQLQEYIPEYKKSYDVSELLSPKLEQALTNSRRLDAYYGAQNYAWPSNECNPRTDVAELIEIIRTGRC